MSVTEKIYQFAQAENILLSGGQKPDIKNNFSINLSLPSSPGNSSDILTLAPALALISDVNGWLQMCEKKVIKAFRYYALHVIDGQQLQTKMDKIIQKSLSSQSSTSPIGITQSDLINAQQLYERSEKACRSAAGQKVVFFIGKSRAGKSTTVNYLAGCKMVSVKPRYLFVSQTKNVILAEKPVAGIGHRGSKTTAPAVIEVPGFAWRYVDCPGFDDTRGIPSEIHNAMVIREVVDFAKEIKGFVIVLSFSDDVEKQGGTSLKENLEYVFQLLKGDFSKFREAFQIVVTKCETGVDVDDVVNILQDRLGDLKKNNQALAGLIDILNENLASKLSICSPCGTSAATERMALLSAIERFKPDPSLQKGDFGYPLSKAALANLLTELTQGNSPLLLQAQKVLKEMLEEVKKYWDSKGESILVEFEASINLLSQCVQELSPCSSAAIMGSQTFQQFVADALIKKLQRLKNHWQQILQLQGQTTSNFDSIVQTDLNAITDALKEIRLKKAYSAIKIALVTTLKSYDIQGSLESVEGNVAPFDVRADENDTRLLSTTLHKLIPMHHPLRLTYLDDIFAQMPAAKSKLATILKTHLFTPFEEKEADNQIIVTATIPAIALSATIKKIQSRLSGNKDLSIRVPKEGALYFDEDISSSALKGRRVTISAVVIDVRKVSKVDLKSPVSYLSGSINFEGKIKGDFQIVNDQLQLSPGTKTIRGFSWSWW